MIGCRSAAKQSTHSARYNNNLATVIQYNVVSGPTQGSCCYKTLLSSFELMCCWWWCRAAACSLGKSFLTTGPKTKIRVPPPNSRHEPDRRRHPPTVTSPRNARARHSRDPCFFLSFFLFFPRTFDSRYSRPSDRPYRASQSHEHPFPFALSFHKLPSGRFNRHHPNANTCVRDAMRQFTYTR